MRLLNTMAMLLIATVFLLAVPGYLLLQATDYIDEQEYEWLWHLCGFGGFVLLILGVAASALGWVALGDYLIGGF